MALYAASKLQHVVAMRFRDMTDLSLIYTETINNSNDEIVFFSTKSSGSQLKEMMTHISDS